MTKQKIVVNKTKTPLQMNYNLVDELAKLRITLPFMEVVKIPQQRENILKILDDTNSRIEDVVKFKASTKYFISKAKG